MKLLQIFFSLLLLSQLTFAKNNPSYKIEKAPKWKTNVALSIQDNDFKNKGSLSYLLLDWQENEISKEYCYRYCIRLNNEEGVEENSQLYFSFDPSYQSLSINRINIHRNGKIINNLFRENIEVMRNEKNTERLLYDGTYSAVVILKDVRVGDILEYEFTLKGQNPIFKGYTFNQVKQAYGVEIQHLHKKIIVSNIDSLIIKSNNGGAKPLVKRIKGVDHLIWNEKNVPAIYADDDIPSWFNAYPLTEISSYKNWKEVSKFMSDLYPVNIKTNKIDRFIKDHSYTNSQEDLIKIIRFIQDEVRYLGLEMGANSHKPHHPETVFQQRFGDCKDKSYLLTTILNKIGIDAWPCLVSTSNINFIDQNVPSPFAFNHVIVKFNFNNIDYWVDPTSNFEAGGLEHLMASRYGKTLIISSDKLGLEDIPQNVKREAKIKEDFWFADSVGRVRYEVESKFYGKLANEKRSENAGSSLSKKMNSYLEFVTQYYDAIQWQSDTALSFHDNTEDNIYTVREKYFIENMWEHRDKDSIELYTSFFPYNFYEFTSTSDDEVRTMPLALKHPVEAEVRIIQHYPKHKKLDENRYQVNVQDSCFQFSYSTITNKRQNEIEVIFKYKSLKNHVPVNQLTQYFKNYDSMNNGCEYPESWGIKDNGKFNLFGPSLFISILFIIFLMLLFKRIYKMNGPRNSIDGEGKVIGGWLVLVMIGLYLSPFTVSYLIYDYGFFNQNDWDIFINSYDEMPFVAGAIYFFELLYNLSLVFFAVFLLILMHLKRSIFPTVFVYYRIAVVVGFILDIGLTSSLMDLDIDSEQYSDLAKTVVASAIWVPYMLFSTRVKNTFVKPYSKIAKSNEVELIAKESYIR